MNPRHSPLLLALVAALFLPCAVRGQDPFDSGSDGSDGALTVNAHTSRTIDLPPDGRLNYTTITLGLNSTVTFKRNNANTPVFILAQGDVVLGGTISVAGQSVSSEQRGGVGGPGGFNGGNGGPVPGDGLGPGGGKGGWVDSGVSDKPDEMPYRGGGSYRTQGENPLVALTRGNLYGNPLLIPIVGGSGGGGGTGPAPTAYVGGGGGGGAILIASNTLIHCNWNNGWAQPFINARGGNGRNGWASGSGGAIRLVAPLVTGGIRFDLRPGGDESLAGYGRIRVDTTTPGELATQGDGRSNEFVTFGSNLVAIAPDAPAVRVVHAAGQAISPDRLDPVFVLLPVGSEPTQTVQVQVENFGTLVPLRATVTPENGDRTTYDFQIDNTAGGASEGSVDVQIPPGVSCRIDVWTR